VSIKDNLDKQRIALSEEYLFIFFLNYKKFTDLTNNETIGFTASQEKLRNILAGVRTNFLYKTSVN
jgi:hypothetical protein